MVRSGIPVWRSGSQTDSNRQLQVSWQGSRTCTNRRDGSEDAERCSDQIFDAGISHVGVFADVVECFSCLSFTKPEAAQRAEGLGVRCGRLGVHLCPIRSAFGIQKSETGRNAALDDQEPPMLC